MKIQENNLIQKIKSYFKSETSSKMDLLLEATSAIKQKFDFQLDNWDYRLKESVYDEEKISNVVHKYTLKLPINYKYKNQEYSAEIYLHGIESDDVNIVAPQISITTKIPYKISNGELGIGITNEKTNRELYPSHKPRDALRADSLFIDFIERSYGYFDVSDFKVCYEIADLISENIEDKFDSIQNVFYAPVVSYFHKAKDLEGDDMKVTMGSVSRLLELMIKGQIKTTTNLAKQYPKLMNEFKLES